MDEFTSFSSDELILTYHKINAELTKQFLNRASWAEQQERINKLGKISKELMRRKLTLDGEHNIPPGTDWQVDN